MARTVDDPLRAARRRMAPPTGSQLPLTPHGRIMFLAFVKMDAVKPAAFHFPAFALTARFAHPQNPEA
jgi:hypothetical protein